jgi:hypothetical protein
MGGILGRQAWERSSGGLWLPSVFYDGAMLMGFCPCVCEYDFVADLEPELYEVSVAIDGGDLEIAFDEFDWYPAAGSLFNGTFILEHETVPITEENYWHSYLHHFMYSEYGDPYYGSVEIYATSSCVGLQWIMNMMGDVEVLYAAWHYTCILPGGELSVLEMPLGVLRLGGNIKYGSSTSCYGVQALYYYTGYTMVVPGNVLGSATLTATAT